MNILFLHEVDWLKKIVFEIHDLSERLSKNHNVFAIDYEDSWHKENAFNMGTLKTKEFKPIERAHKDAKVTLRRPGMIRLPILDKSSALLTHYFEIKRIIKKEKIDVIVLYSVPTDGIQIISLAKRYNIPVIFRSIDILHQLVDNRFLRNLTYSLEKIVYRNVDKILTLTPKLSEYVIKMDGDKNKVELFPTGVDTKKFRPMNASETFRKNIGISERDKVIIFMGTLFDFSRMDQYVDQFSTILKKIPETKLLIVGGGDLYEELEELVEKKGLQGKVILTGFQPYEMMQQYINIADICINPFQINEITRDVLPIKVLQYLACGKPVIATPLPGLMSVISDESCGITYSEDIDQMTRDTITLLRSNNKLDQLGQNATTYIENHHDMDGIVDRLEQIMTNLIIERGGN